jgi:hypothetical protein
VVHGGGLMQERAKIVAIDKDIVTVMPLDIDACIGCSNSECKTNGNVFIAVNNRKLKIKVGSEVLIGAAVKNQLWQAFFAVGVPVLFSIGVWNLVPYFISGAGEGFQVGCTVLAFFVCTGFIYWGSRIASKNLPEIVEVL